MEGHCCADPVVPCCDRLVFLYYFSNNRDNIFYYDRKTAAEPSQGRLLSCFCLELTIVHGVRTWPHPLNRVHACVRLLFEGGYYFFGGAPGVATIRGWLLFGVRLLFE